MIEIALDGPSGAGKSTLARAAAKQLGYLYVDTGACYRAAALYAIQKGIDLSNPDNFVSELENIEIELKHNENGEQRVILNGKDVSDDIRTAEVSEKSSLISAIPEVRNWLLELQRGMSKVQNIIMDGRDIGTVVLPNAHIKIFLTAAIEERAKRRHLEYLAKGVEIGYDKVLEELLKRDQRDTERKVAPLKKAEDAICLDSTDLTFEETLESILKIIKDRDEENVLHSH